MKINELLNGFMNMRFVLISLLMLLCANSFAARTTTYLHSDMLGSTVAATNEAGNLIWRKNYEPYGTSFTYDKTGDDSEQDIVDHTGHSKDLDMELTYMGARWYDPEIGRFLSIDPASVAGNIISNPMMFNRYAYANNNPYKYVDPDGRDPSGFALAREGIREIKRTNPELHARGSRYAAYAGAAIVLPVVIWEVGLAAFTNPITTMEIAAGLSETGVAFTATSKIITSTQFTSIVDEVVKLSNGKIRVAVEEANKAGLNQAQVIEVIKQVTEETGRNIGTIADIGGGTKVLTGVLRGPMQPVVAVGSDGTSRMGTATLSLGESGLKVTDIELP